MPEAVAEVVRLAPADAYGVPYDPVGWPGRAVGRMAPDGFHLLIRQAGQLHRLWLPDGEPPPGSRLAPLLDYGPYASERHEASLRFWRLLTRRRQRAPPRPARVARQAWRSARMLLALDLRAAGASERDIARALFGTIARGDWPDHPDRSAVRRLLDGGDALMQGGYRRLLLPPRPARPLG